jgi:hypothetical protein
VAGPGLGLGLVLDVEVAVDEDGGNESNEESLTMPELGRFSVS